MPPVSRDLRSPDEIPRDTRPDSFVVESAFTRCDVTLRCPMLSVKSVLVGEETYHFGDRAILVKAGMFLLVPAGVPYSVSVKTRWPTRGRCFYWSGQDAMSLHALQELIGKTAGPEPFDLAVVSDTLVRLAPIRDPKGLADDFNRWARRWTDHLARVDRVDPLSRSRVLRGLERAFRAMGDDPSHGWSTAELARLAGQSRSAFSRSFARVYGRGPRQMLEQLRMDLAVRALDKGDRPLTELAQDCGYADLPTFSKAFRRCYGVAPSRWRAAGQSGTNRQAKRCDS